MKLRPLAPGLTPREVLKHLSGIMMVDVYIPTTDGRTLILPRFTDPTPAQQVLLDQLRLTLPPQPPPRLKAEQVTASLDDSAPNDAPASGLPGHAAADL